jgi:hypothetical protein
MVGYCRIVIRDACGAARGTDTGGPGNDAINTLWQTDWFIGLRGYVDCGYQMAMNDAGRKGKSTGRPSRERSRRYETFVNQKAKLIQLVGDLLPCGHRSYQVK